MRFKKILIIPLLFFAYIWMINALFINPSPKISQGGGQDAPGAAVIGVGEGISVLVTRPYLFGIIRLPVYTNTVGYIGSLHTMFFYFLGILAVVFIVIEIINRRSRKWQKKKRKK